MPREEESRPPRRRRTGEGGGRGRNARSGARRGDARGASGATKERRKPSPRRRIDLEGGADLPRWVREEVARTTRKDRRDATLSLLATGAEAFAEGRYGVARARLLEAKELSPRAAVVRELLGLAGYRLGRWKEALSELRTYRRLSGDTTHMAVEMDALRALGRVTDVEKTWRSFRELGGSPLAEIEARVVYGSFLLDRGQLRAAWQVTNPGRISKTPREGDLRQWYVAARAAASLGDAATAQRLLEAIEKADPALPGLDELEAEVRKAVERSER